MCLSYCVPNSSVHNLFFKTGHLLTVPAQAPADWASGLLRKLSAHAWGILDEADAIRQEARRRPEVICSSSKRQAAHRLVKEASSDN